MHARTINDGQTRFAAYFFYYSLLSELPRQVAEIFNL